MIVANLQMGMVSSILQPPLQKKPFHFQNKENAALAGKAKSGEMDDAASSGLDEIQLLV